MALKTRRRGAAAGRLTRTEIIADLEGMGLEFDPRHSHAELLAQRNAGRAQRAAA